MRPTRLLLSIAFLAAGCSGSADTPVPTAAPIAKLGIKPDGETTLGPDLARVPDELKRVFTHIDTNIDEHVENLQKWIQQPSISNTGEGIQESAQMVKGFFDQLGCQESRVYDVGVTEWGAQGNPVVYAKCDEGAEKTLVIYWMYDTMPITQPDAWTYPPFEGRIVEQPPYKKVLIGRGATNSKGPQMAQWNALMSIKAVTGKLPVNVIFVAEGDEERMSIGFRKFVKDHPDLFKGADAMYRFGWQAPSGGGEFSAGSEGCVYIELTTSGVKWGRGPTRSDIHGAWKRSTDSPAWRHIKMLASLVSEDGNTALVDGFYDNGEPLSEAEESRLKQAASKVDMKVAADNMGVARFISDDPYTMLKMTLYGQSFNIDGIWGGNMFPGGAGAVLPNKVTSKHNMRYKPGQDGMDLVKKIRAQLDKNGYQDVELKVIGDVPWSKMTYDNDAARAVFTMLDVFRIPHATPVDTPTILGPYWPAYLFARDPIQIPIIAGGAGLGGGAHAANEFWVIEGAGKVYGMAGAEKSVATMLYAYAGKIPSPGKLTD